MATYIQIKLYATLRQYLPDSADKFEITPGMTIRDVTKLLGIPENLAKLIFVNSSKHDLNTVLKDDDRVGIFPPVGGG